MEATIKINRMKLFARHGVLPQERVVGNDFEVTVEVDAVMDRASLESDELSATVNYADIAALIKREMAIPSQLIEHVAWRIGHAVMEELHGVSGCRVTVAKLLPPIPSVQLDSASVTLAFP